MANDTTDGLDSDDVVRSGITEIDLDEDDPDFGNAKDANGQDIFGGQFISEVGGGTEWASEPKEIEL